MITNGQSLMEPPNKAIYAHLNNNNSPAGFVLM